MLAPACLEHLAQEVLQIQGHLALNLATAIDFRILAQVNTSTGGRIEEEHPSALVSLCRLIFGIGRINDTDMAVWRIGEELYST